jgi:hypothetical protein
MVADARGVALAAPGVAVLVALLELPEPQAASRIAPQPLPMIAAMYRRRMDFLRPVAPSKQGRGGRPVLPSR